jgi:TetR/AcrR family transcriptional regulator, tetracycline repressor protein
VAFTRTEAAPLTENVKPRLLGHWGTTPGLNLIYAHLNRMIRHWDLDMMYVCGPGHGGPGMVANTEAEAAPAALCEYVMGRREADTGRFRTVAGPFPQGAGAAGRGGYRHHRQEDDMARPKVPLISRRKALEAALQIVDSQGLAALSIRRLGEALHVNGASLYHHFKNKEDILTGITQLALADVTAHRSETGNWRVWLPVNTYRTRQALIAHPALIQVLLRRVPLGIGTRELEASVVRMEQEGAPVQAIAPLMQSLELLAIVSALQQTGHADPAAIPGPGPGPDPGPAIERAERARALSTDEIFETACASVMSAIETAVQLKLAKKTARPRRTASGQTG